MSQSTAMKLLILIMFAVTVLAAAPGKQTFTGTITDSMCSTADHSQMKMGPTDAECTKACVSIHGATYVLYDGKNIYELSDQKTPEKFAAKKVTVTGTLDAKSKKIQVDSITAAK
jgi:type 1 fimbria pilin